MIESPTPPQPITTTEAPGSTFAVLMAAPTPVATAQPMSAPTSAGSSSGHGHRGGLGHDRSLTEGADAEVRPHVLAALPVKAGGAVDHAVLERAAVLAEPGLAGVAPAAVATGREPREGDPVARLHRAHALAHRLDLGEALVPQHHRGSALPVALDHVQVGAAHAGGEHAQRHLTPAGRVDLELFDCEWLVRAVEDCAAHAREPTWNPPRSHGDVPTARSRPERSFAAAPAPAATRPPRAGRRRARSAGSRG